MSTEGWWWCRKTRWDYWYSVVMNSFLQWQSLQIACTASSQQAFVSILSKNIPWWPQAACIFFNNSSPWHSLLGSFLLDFPEWEKQMLAIFLNDLHTVWADRHWGLAFRRPAMLTAKQVQQLHRTAWKSAIDIPWGCILFLLFWK